MAQLKTKNSNFLRKSENKKMKLELESKEVKKVKFNPQAEVQQIPKRKRRRK